ncbi:MAG TPA: hypothetical protein EYP57_02890 [Thermodesulfobacteriaceae bacterium]|nr:hypothetical protein [Thermodesulfobacteriaceae bacterium]
MINRDLITRNINSRNTSNTYLPHPAVITEVITENSQIKTFVLEFTDKTLNTNFSYESGQFVMLSVPHHGEAPISISSTPTRPGNIHLSVRIAGRLTTALHKMEPGMTLGIRGPYGRPFPVHIMEGRDLLFVAGGIGLAPLRSVINYCLDRTGRYGTMTILYGSRLPSDIAFRQDLDIWSTLPGITCLTTVDTPEPGWTGHVGVVTTLWDHIQISPSDCTALVCGPPMMIKFVLRDLAGMSFSPDFVITTMERHMKCGVGLCGHCYMGGKLVCTDGPVFSMAELKDMDIEELR